MFLLGQAFGYFNITQADTVKTPEDLYYKGIPDEGESRNDTNEETNPK